jgi:hypothetical protein
MRYGSLGSRVLRSYVNLRRVSDGSSAIDFTQRGPSFEGLFTIRLFA